VYLHLEDVIVEPGQAVEKGQQLGVVGTGAHAMIDLTPPTTTGSAGGLWGARRKYENQKGQQRDGIHEGIDFPAAVGEDLLAAADGTVVFIKDPGDFGRWIAIDHGNGIFTRYLHNDSHIVSVGQKVVRGQKIGTVGKDGVSGGPHVHFEVRLTKSAKDTYIGKYGIPTNILGKKTLGRRKSWIKVKGKTVYTWSVPVETFMGGATYQPAIESTTRGYGVTFYDEAAQNVFKFGLWDYDSSPELTGSGRLDFSVDPKPYLSAWDKDYVPEDDEDPEEPSE
jgi:murein DD-endopeptidase MepM/ murein hydrolase activator NlpD